MRTNGSIIGYLNCPNQSTAAGIWDLNAVALRKISSWPIAGTNLITSADLPATTAVRGFQRWNGCQITLSQNLSVAALGMWVIPANADVFVPVKITDTSGNLVGSAVSIPQRNAAGWTFVEISPVTLTSGTSYILQQYDSVANAFFNMGSYSATVASIDHGRYGSGSYADSVFGSTNQILGLPSLLYT